MKTSFKKSWWQMAFACLILTVSAGVSQAQIKVTNLITSFPNSASVGAWSFSDWNGTPNATVSWAAGPTYDAQGNPASGSMECNVPLSSSEHGATCVFNVGGLNTNESAYTAMEFDIKIDPTSGADKYGNAVELKPGVQVTSAYTYGADDFNIAIVSTNNGWQHVVASGMGMGNFANWDDVVQIFFQCQDYNETNTSPVSAIFYIDNLAFTALATTFPNFTDDTLQFTDTNSVVAVFGADNAVTGMTSGWYGNTNYVDWSTNDSGGDTNSGSLYISAAFTSGNNNLVLVIPFDPTLGAYGTETNPADIINANDYTGVSLDVMWDTNNSTIELSDFNANGDVDGFPIGLCDTPGFTVDETFGSTTTVIPNAASNGWVRITCPFAKVFPADQTCDGLWFKKWGGGGSLNGTVAFWVDNVVFNGGVIPTHPNQATETLVKPSYGLQCDFTGTAGNASYDRETICTDNNTYSFVDAGSVTYGISFSESGANSSGLICFDQNGTAHEPDWNDPDIFRIAIQQNAAGSTVTLQCKTNTPDNNGDLYDASDPVWTNNSSPVGDWLFTISNNTNILCVGPNGNSTNLPFPLGFQSADVEANFPAGDGMYVYFGAMGGGSASEGNRWVMTKCSVSGGTATPLSENWVAEANTGSYLNGGEAGQGGSTGGNTIPAQDTVWTGNISGVSWNNTSDSSTGYGLYLIGTNTPFALDWTAIAGNGLLVLTNTTLNPGTWGTNAALTAKAWLDADYYSSEIDETNITPGGDQFFMLQNP
jgi:hypothetical protein